MLQETVAGVVVVESSSDVRHEGLTLLMEGTVSLQFSSKNVGILDAFSNNLKVHNTVDHTKLDRTGIGCHKISYN